MIRGIDILSGTKKCAIAVTLNLKLAVIVFLLGFVAHFIAIPLAGKHARKERVQLRN
jgi:hypothetical protein